MLFWVIRNAVWVLIGSHALAFMVGRWSRRGHGHCGHQVAPIHDAYRHTPYVVPDCCGGSSGYGMGSFLRGALVFALIVGAILVAQYYYDWTCIPMPGCW